MKSDTKSEPKTKTQKIMKKNTDGSLSVAERALAHNSIQFLNGKQTTTLDHIDRCLLIYLNANKYYESSTRLPNQAKPLMFQVSYWLFVLSLTNGKHTHTHITMECVCVCVFNESRQILLNMKCKQHRIEEWNVYECVLVYVL